MLHSGMDIGNVDRDSDNKHMIMLKDHRQWHKLGRSFLLLSTLGLKGLGSGSLTGGRHSKPSVGTMSVGGKVITSSKTMAKEESDLRNQD